MLRNSIIALSVAGLVAGCAQSGNTPAVGQNTGAGAILGAVGGAIVGGLIGGNRKGALIGAGIGAVTGAGVGVYLDNQQAELEKNLEGTGATVTNTGTELLVNLPSNITFAVDRAEIQPQFQDSLSRVASTLVQYESSVIDVIGHTDSTGSDAYNQDLSQRRANSVANFLIGRGVIRERIVAYGQGESAPIASNDTAEGRAQNRRVELRIVPLTEGS
jgi:outer membrane protein OmpA-like peptidoglycan-associated protein